MDAKLSSGSCKRPRANRNTVQVPSCLVDGCVADLSVCREYHRRHKVCEAHSKTPRVTIDGWEQRFCQQCSRFHPLGEFDDSKRSCRKRLDGHNRRRRKPQPDLLSFDSSLYMAAHQGSKFGSYGTWHFPNGAAPTSSWSNAVKAQNSHLYTPNSLLSFKTNNIPSPFSIGHRVEKRFPFLQNADHLSQPHLSNLSSTLGDSGSSNSHRLLFSDGFDRVIDSDRASSLLSSSNSETCGFIPTNFFQQPTESSFIPRTHHNSPAMDSFPLVPASCSDYNVNIDCAEMSQNGSSGCHQTITFSWE